MTFGLQELINMSLPLLWMLGGYYARKAHTTELDLAVLRGEILRDRTHSAERHVETMGIMKEMRDDVRDLRTSWHSFAQRLKE
jgi:hypothetical protein